MQRLPFRLRDERVPIAPYFEEPANPRPLLGVHIVEQNGLLSIVPIPPFRSSLRVKVGVLCEDGKCLAASSLAMNPDTTGRWEESRKGLVVPVDSFEGGVTSDSDVAGHIEKVSEFSRLPGGVPSKAFIISSSDWVHGGNTGLKEVAVFFTVGDTLGGESAGWLHVASQDSSDVVEGAGIGEIDESL